MKFRTATNLDGEAIQSLIDPILRSYGLSLSPEDTDGDLCNIEEHYQNNRGRFDVLVDHRDKIFGTVAIHQTSADLCELRKMYLDASLRGKGWGRKLLHRAFAISRKLGYKKIWLETAHNLTEAQSLYQQNGFERFAGPHCSHRCDFALARKL